MDEPEESLSHNSGDNPPSGESVSTAHCNGVPGRRALLREPEAHGLQLLAVLRSFREQGLMFDFTIRVQERSFPCHRCVIAACSDFFRCVCLSIYPSIMHLSIYRSVCDCVVFRALFEVDMRERGDGSVTLGNQCTAAVGSFLDFAYSGETLITDGNVDMMFQLASFLQVEIQFFLFFC